VPARFSAQALPAIKFSLFAFFTACIFAGIAGSRHWPLVNDAALMHSIAFLLDHGMAPYREITEVNWPGAYLVNWAVIHTLGGSVLAWRIFDLAVLVALEAAGIALTVSCQGTAFSGFLGASLFWLYHLRDGAGQSGQRDLCVGVLMAIGMACAMNSRMRRLRLSAFVAGVACGAGLMIKPVAFFLIPAVVTAAFESTSSSERKMILRSMIGGALLPVVLVLFFLIYERSLSSFFITGLPLMSFHAALGRQGFFYTLKSAFAGSILTMAALTAGMALLRRQQSRLAWASMLGAIGGLVSYLFQAKCYPYQRYPMLIFLFLWMGVEIVEAWRNKQSDIRSSAGQVFAFASLVFAVAVAPLYARRAERTRWNDAVPTAIVADINRLGGTKALDRQVQCLDTTGGCLDALYRLRLVQATGMVYDEFLFNKDVPSAAVERVRMNFIQQMDANPPKVIIATRWLFPSGPSDYRKLDSSPELTELLRQRYVLLEERDFGVGETGPLGYRLYVLRSWDTNK
jgi:uncharacterized membrane protein (DUF485 family)